MKPHHKKPRAGGASQRQLRAGELIRHALAELYREDPPRDALLDDLLVSFTEVRMSPDLRHATCFIGTLGDSRTDQAVICLNHHARYLRGQLGRRIDMKFTPDLQFRRDESFETARRVDMLLNDPKVRADLDKPETGDGGPGDDGS